MPFAVPTFLGALLLFLVEPLTAKGLLPLAGGSSSTWTACLVTFQALLLAGYAFVAWTSARLSPSAQARLQASILFVAAAFALRASASAPDVPDVPTALDVVFVVLRRVGAPFFVLATTTPLLAHVASVTGTRAPRLYALSNAGSFVGLLSYPFLVEPWLSLQAGYVLFAVGFVVYGLTCAPALRAASRVHETPHVSSLPAASSPAEWTLWVCLAAVPSVLLLAVTAHVTVDVAATPLLWVVPLAVYLASFVVAFAAPDVLPRGAIVAVFAASTAVVALDAFAAARTPIARELSACLVALGACSVLCHTELARRRPEGRNLTGFYLAMSLGGVLGGVFVTFVAPFVFSDAFELEVAAVATFLVLVPASRRASPVWGRGARLALYLGAGLCVPLLAGSVAVRVATSARDGRVVERRRSFLGRYRVVETHDARILTHGRIQHGMQLLAPALARTPTMYFAEGTALGRVLTRFEPDRPRRVGVVGLGVGTIAAYGRAGDALRFYELDPVVVELARADFSYLRDSAASVTVVVGDGRLALGRESPQAFDVLVLDAFSSDAVPVHLVTREAFAVYARHLAPGGVILANASNRFLAVDRALVASGAAVGLGAVLVETATDPARHAAHAEWVVMGRNLADIQSLSVPGGRVPEANFGVLFTDSRASVLSILK